MDQPPRYAPALPLPPYSYVPGKFSHPISSPAGHSYGKELIPPLTLGDDWTISLTYRYGIDLFNRGYYWEAHEAWESLWHMDGRRGDAADYLKGLIKLGAMGVKLREGNVRGALRHASRSVELLSTAHITSDHAHLDIAVALRIAQGVVVDADRFVDTSAAPVVRLFSDILVWRSIAKDE